MLNLRTGEQFPEQGGKNKGPEGCLGEEVGRSQAGSDFSVCGCVCVCGGGPVGREQGELKVLELVKAIISESLEGCIF